MTTAALQILESFDRLADAEKQLVVTEILRRSAHSGNRPPAADAGERMRAALEKLAASGAVDSIGNPVSWQREERRDRSLA